MPQLFLSFALEVTFDQSGHKNWEDSSSKNGPKTDQNLLKVRPEMNHTKFRARGNFWSIKNHPSKSEEHPSKIIFNPFFVLLQLQNEKRRLERELEEIKRQKEEQDDENERLRQELASLR